MNHYIRLLFLLMLLLLATACANEDAEKKKTTPKQETQIKKTATEKKLPRDMDNPPFTKFELEAEYDANKSYEVEYDSLKAQEEAEIEDFIHQKLIKGQEAAEIIQNNLKLIEIDEATPEQQVIDQIIEAFQLEHTYKTVKVEVRFPNGKEKTYVVKR
jgi:hypothetical protein